MTPERWQRVQERFHEAAGLGPEERGAFLNDACGDDAVLRAEVESLLACDEEAPADFMRPPERGPEADLGGEPEAPDPLIGTRISRYHIQKVIAAGGMGTVYEAEQDNPKRIVALKVMRAGVTSRVALRHFEREAQILARLRHPNIAQVFEAGTHSDASTGGSAVPYFAMEYVPDALTIDQYVKGKQLDVRERLELFAQVCDAVHHGHQKGIIHRDLKPGNVLVDSSGLPKVIDFGVARSTDSDVAVTTMRTDASQLIGTLQYMSPEQCDADPHELDIRSDVYSLGAVLYELLTGELPYDAGGGTIYKAAKVIKECTPQRPSSINHKLRGDVETIVLKALEKDRTKRYQSAADFARDIRHYLNREPIEAKRPTVWARSVRWVAQHPITVTASGCLVLAMLTVIATTTSIWYLRMRPYDMELGTDGREARLVSVAGHIVHRWRAERENGITAAELLSPPGESSSGSLAVIGYSAAADNPYPGAVCAFPVVGNRDRPAWCRHIEEADVLPSLRERGIGHDGFGVHRCKLIDVLQETPGEEIVVLHDYSSVGVSAIRIYDHYGRVLFQAWHNGSIIDVYWMSEPKLLVASAFNNEAKWPQRGYPDVHDPYPIVLFAIRPVSGFLGARYLHSEPTRDPVGPLWYKCLLPPNASELLHGPVLGAPERTLSPSRYLFLTLPARVFNGRIGWAIDEHGEEALGSRIVSARYSLVEGLPDTEQFRLGPLPPIVSGTERAEQKSERGDP